MEYALSACVKYFQAGPLRPGGQCRTADGHALSARAVCTTCLWK